MPCGTRRAESTSPATRSFASQPRWYSRNSATPGTNCTSVLERGGDFGADVGTLIPRPPFLTSDATTTRAAHLTTRDRRDRGVARSSPCSGEWVAPPDGSAGSRNRVGGCGRSPARARPAWSDERVELRRGRVVGGAGLVAAAVLGLAGCGQGPATPAAAVSRAAAVTAAAALAGPTTGDVLVQGTVRRADPSGGPTHVQVVLWAPTGDQVIDVSMDLGTRQVTLTD